MKRIFIPLLVSPLLMASTVLALQGDAETPPPLLDRELFFGPPRISGAQLSPDGQWMCFIKAYKGVRNIWLKRAKEPFEAARAVTDSRRPVPSCFWSRNSDYLLYEQDRRGDEMYHIWRVKLADIRKGEERVPPAMDLTPLKGVRTVIYALPKNQPGTIILGLNQRDPAIHDPYRVDIATGKRELVRENRTLIGSWVFDQDGELRLAMRSLPGGGLELLRVEPENFTRIAAVTAEEELTLLECSDDDNSCYAVSNAGREIDLLRLMQLDLETGKMEFVEQDPEGEVDFGAAAFHPLSDELQFTTYLGDRLRVYPKTKEAARLWEGLRKALPDGEITFISVVDDLSLLLVKVSSDVDPGSIYLYEPESGKSTLLYRVRPDLPRQHLAQMQPLGFKARDGMTIYGYLTLPRGVEPRNLPTVMYIHGGPWKRNYWRSEPYVQFLANRGYAVMQVNYRGSAGYGKRYLNAGIREHGTGAMSHDITDAVAYLKRKGIADPERIAIFGGSFGGYLTLAGVTYTPDIYACGIPYVAPSNLVTFTESFPDYWKPFLENSWYRWIGNPGIATDRQEMIERSPLFKADRIKAPLLVIHGANDPRVQQREADQIVLALRDRGKPVEYLVAPDEGHGFNAAHNRMAMAAAIEQFLAKHLRGRYQEKVRPVIRKRLARIRVDVSTLKTDSANSD
jgi:dipeptidyl aminopeptidase/acylaminoacyl peptidase